MPINQLIREGRIDAIKGASLIVPSSMPFENLAWWIVPTLSRTLSLKKSSRLVQPPPPIPKK